VAAVLADIESLPSAESHAPRSTSEPTTGLYL
jgi:hypothetical protein